MGFQPQVPGESGIVSVHAAVPIPISGGVDKRRNEDIDDKNCSKAVFALDLFFFFFFNSGFKSNLRKKWTQNADDPFVVHYISSRVQLSTGTWEERCP